MSRWFSHLASRTADWMGHPGAFMTAAAVILLWAITGPIFHFSDTWQLVINTGTTIVTFLMVFLIQNTQNRDSKALHIKMDEIIRALDGARDQFIDAEDLDTSDLDRIREEFRQIVKQALVEHTGGLSSPYDSTSSQKPLRSSGSIK
jgi:low affinity Fe/Cu permease